MLVNAPSAILGNSEDTEVIMITSKLNMLAQSAAYYRYTVCIRIVGNK